MEYLVNNISKSGPEQLAGKWIQQTISRSILQHLEATSNWRFLAIVIEADREARATVAIREATGVLQKTEREREKESTS